MTLGMLGDGQLGRLMALEAARMGVDVHVFGPTTDSPAARVSPASTVAAWDDEAALRRFASEVDVVTYEWENVPVSAVRTLEDAGAVVLPGARALEVAQDRLNEKTLFRDLGARTAPFFPVDSVSDLVSALRETGGQGILKRRRGGYDGKGQARVEADENLAAAIEDLGGGDLILEGIAPFAYEVSVIAARGRDGAFCAYDVPRNVHRAGILRASHVPSPLSPTATEQAVEVARSVAVALDYMGVLAVEFFVMDDEALWVNEMAPRVHNSGHWTPEACITGQFEQHVRAVLGWPLGDVRRHSDARMENLLGHDISAADRLRSEGAHVTLYGKAEARPGRKMGHAVWVSPTIAS